ncbi:hypothetical protein K469DRAFT_577442 [Zopfia rhizophila CBS 207.26]|uniref:Large ribosomal subunit protein bL34m n=1 Tax=Zopfia rhizophila CBS 207.26 TaxID=1314779 RepID=A0A6A6DZI9_9PEZI|nr:hypothetical protein K469DRAFT_577442 [Zopfia rhizophila CBS 207.26]
MNSFRCLRALARPTHTATTPIPSLLRPSAARTALPQSRITTQLFRSLSLLSPRRPRLTFSPVLPSSSTPSTAQTPTNAETLDLLPKISSHPGLLSTQVRCGPRDTYNPSHFVRKRRHGFLSRLRTKNGRKTLKRRLLKKRSTLSH